jgi:hypothetical protein
MRCGMWATLGPARVMEKLAENGGKVPPDLIA